MIYCPTWDLSTIPHETLTSEYQRRRNARRASFGGGRPVVPRPCPQCGQLFGVRKLREHRKAAHSQPQQ